MSSLDFNECAHKLMKIKLPQGQEMELCNMLIECCSQERTYMRFYGLLGQRFSMLDRSYQECFEKTFIAQVNHLFYNYLLIICYFLANHLLIICNYLLFYCL